MIAILTREHAVEHLPSLAPTMDGAMSIQWLTEGGDPKGGYCLVDESTVWVNTTQETIDAMIADGWTLVEMVEPTEGS